MHTGEYGDVSADISNMC